MTFEELQRRAEEAQALKDHAAFRWVIREVQEEATAKFLSASELSEDVQKAHSQVRAVAAIVNRLDWAIANYQNAKKDRHRGNDR